MRKLRITVVDLVTKGPTSRLYNRVMNANLASIMPQAVAVWCEELGHDVRYICYTCVEALAAALSQDNDVPSIGASPRQAQPPIPPANLHRPAPHAHPGTTT